MEKRVALWGSIITGFGGWVMAINSMMGSNEVGAGVCVVGSALAFSVVAFLSRQK